MRKLIVLLFVIVCIKINYAQNFIPANYKPALWLDASDAGTIIHASNGKVSSWQDKSGNGSHCYQTNSNNQPTFSNSSVGVYFDSNDVLVGNNLQYGTDDMITLFIVAEPDDNANKGSVIAKGQWTSGNDYRIELGENGYDICIRQEREWNRGGASWDITHKNIVHTYLDEDNYVGYYLNGTAQETPRLDLGTYTPNNSPFSIGARFNNSNNFKGKIYEVLYF